MTQEQIDKVGSACGRRGIERIPMSAAGIGTKIEEQFQNLLILIVDCRAKEGPARRMFEVGIAAVTKQELDEGMVV